MLQKCLKFLKLGVKNADLYGIPIQLNHKGNDKSKTILGGVASILTVIGLLVYFTMQMNDVIQKSSFVQSSTIYRTLNEYNSSISLNQEQFDVALSFIFDQSKYSLLDQYITVYLEQAYIDFSPTYFNPVVTQKPFEPCTSNRFDKQSFFQQGKNSQGDFYCINDDSYTFQFEGGSTTVSSKSVGIRVQKCDSGRLEELYPGQDLSCKTEEEIEVFASEAFLGLFIISEYFDSNDFIDPIKSNFYVHPLTLNPTLGQIKVLLLSQNSAVTYDSWLTSQYFSKEYTYISVNSVQESISSFQYSKMGNTYLMVTIFLCEEQLQIQRTRFNFVDVLSNTGGLFGILFACVSFTINGFQDYILKRDLIKNLYLFKKANKVNSLYQKRLSSSVFDFERSQIQQNGNKDILKQTLKEVTEPIKIKFGLKTLIFDKLGQICCRGFIYKRKEGGHLSLFKQARKRFERDTDITNIIIELRLIRKLSLILLSKSQRKWLRFFKDNVIQQEQLLCNDSQLLIDQLRGNTTYGQDEMENELKILVQKSTQQKIYKRFLKHLAPNLISSNKNSQIQQSQEKLVLGQKVRLQNYKQKRNSVLPEKLKKLSTNELSSKQMGQRQYDLENDWL